MVNIKLYTSICLTLVFTIQLVTARKYDIETEAMRLYGEDLQSVLAKFRRTPDYLQILEEKYAEMATLFNEIATYGMQYTLDNKLKKRVADVCGYGESTPKGAMAYKARGLRQDEHTEPTLPPEEPSTPIPPAPELATQEEITKSPRNPIDLLEQYPHFKNHLSVQERNGIRDLAFEVTGEMIHMIIQSMGPVESQKLAKSTRLPFGGEAGKVETTTEMDHRHKITKAHNDEYISTSTTHSPDEKEKETYYMRFKKP